MIECFQCQSQIKVTITGGEFLVRVGSMMDNFNFEKAVKIDLGTAEIMDEDVMLEVKVECSADPTHTIFGQTDSGIRAEIYKRIATAATEFYKQHHTITK